MRGGWRGSRGGGVGRRRSARVGGGCGDGGGRACRDRWFPVGGKEAIAIEEQVLALLEGLGDKRRVAAHLNGLGARYSNNRDVKRATEAHQRALELFAAVGDERGQGESLMWLGHLHLHDMADPVRALEHLEKARPLLHAGQDPALEAVCVADIRALRASGFADGTASGELVAYSATADVFQTGSAGRCAGAGRTGSASRDPCRRPPARPGASWPGAHARRPPAGWVVLRTEESA